MIYIHQFVTFIVHIIKLYSGLFIVYKVGLCSSWLAVLDISMALACMYFFVETIVGRVEDVWLDDVFSGDRFIALMLVDCLQYLWRGYEFTLFYKTVMLNGDC